MCCLFLNTFFIKKVPLYWLFFLNEEAPLYGINLEEGWCSIYDYFRPKQKRTRELK